MIAVRGLAVRYGGTEVVADIDLALAPGAIVGLMGPPEAGKSVLLKALAGLVPWHAGSLVVDGVACDADTDAWRAGVGFAFQNDALFDALTVYDNVALPLRERGVAAAEVATRVPAALAAVALTAPHIAGALPEALSGGMRKRVGIARAMVANPRLGLFDDPVAGLDPETARRIMDLAVAQARTQGAAALIVSNDLPTLLPACDRVLMLHAGLKIYDGPPQQLLQGAPPPAVRQFVLGEDAGPL